MTPTPIRDIDSPAAHTPAASLSTAQLRRALVARSQPWSLVIGLLLGGSSTGAALSLAHTPAPDPAPQAAPQAAPTEPAAELELDREACDRATIEARRALDYFTALADWCELPDESRPTPRPKPRERTTP